MKRAAIVDIGTNSTRLLIATIEDGKVVDEPERRSNVTRLGAGVDSDGRLRDDAMQRVYDTLDEYRELIDKHHADTAKAVLTSAVRDAANGQEFADTVRDRYGLEPHVLTGDQEANLTFLGATSERDPHDDTTVLVIDIGGGSTEFVIGTGRQAGFHVSNQAGVVRQTERHLHSDPPTDSEIDNLAADVRKIIEAGVPAEHREAVSARDRSRRYGHLAGVDRPAARPVRPARRSRDTCSQTESDQPSRTASHQPRLSSASKRPAWTPHARRRSSPGL